MQPVILAGGTGSRLWPLSRQHHPKQFLPLIGEQSLLQLCLARAAQLSSTPALLVGREEHRFLLAQQLQESGLKGRILLEPEGRNTAASLVLAALDACEQGQPNRLLLGLPADQIITPAGALQQAVETAIPAAKAGQFCLFGIPPDHPASGYGYILPGSRVRFVEKPPKEQAEQLIAQGALWNSGLLLTRADTLLDRLARLQPELIRLCRQAWRERSSDLDFVRVSAPPFSACPDISIDHALLEPSANCHLTPLDADWQDLGSWPALEQQLEEAPDGCRVQGRVTRLDCQHTLFMGGKRLIAALGLKNLLVVDTPDALLLASRSHADQMRSLVQQLEQAQCPELISHPRVHRPWGYYEHLIDGPGFRVKYLHVNPSSALSLQRHRHRAEHWVILDGLAQITRDQEQLCLRANESIAIARGQVHRLANPGSAPLLVLEVQSGPLLDEADIERLEDHYGRC